MPAPTLHLGHVVTPLPDGGLRSVPAGGVLVDAAGRIEAVGPAEDLRQAAPGAEVADHGDALVLPGFVDTHVHLAQVFARARVAGTLLGWLDAAIFPAEQAFADVGHAERAALAFAADCARQGVTTACVFLTVHAPAAQRAFEVVAAAGLRAVMGLVHMDRNAPPALLAPATRSVAEAEELAARWHGHDGGRLRYALTPRFAYACSRDLLHALGRLRASAPDLHVHTHLSENPDECAAVEAAHRDARDYLDVYDRAGLVGPGAVFAHAIHLSERELARLGASGAGVAHCPSSNLFLKSGVFPWARHAAAGVRFGLGSDVGAGPEMSPFRVMRDAFMVQPAAAPSPRELLWRATLGGARALGLDDRIGALAPGLDADLVVVDPAARPEIAAMLPLGLDDLLAALVFLGDDRVVRRAWVRGRALDAPRP